MSLLLQALLGANVDGSGLSLHADGRTRRDRCDDSPMAVGAEEVAKEGQNHGQVVGNLYHLIFYSWREARELGKNEPKLSKIAGARSPQVRVQAVEKIER